MAGSLSKIIKRFGGRRLLKEYYELIKSLKSNKLYEFAEESSKDQDREPIKLPKTYRKINIKSCNDKYAVQYLKKRRIDQWTINKFKIGYTTWDEEDKSWAGRLIIPSYDDFGRLNYFVGRDFMPEKKDASFKRIKYKNCDADKKESIFQEGLIDWDSDITLVEGALDCIYGPNTISMLGKFLTKDSELFKTLVERAKAKVIICLDNDTKEEESLKICRLLNETKLSGRIWYIRMDEYKDFGEAFEKDGVKGITKVLRSAVKYDQDKDI
jgi:DNA primase